MGKDNRGKRKSLKLENIPLNLKTKGMVFIGVKQVMIPNFDIYTHQKRNEYNWEEGHLSVLSIKLFRNVGLLVHVFQTLSL